MSDFIDFITCRISIVTNLLPMYQISLVAYLGIPVLVITYYRFKHPKVHPIILAAILLLIWLVQITLWEHIYQKQIESSN